MNAQLTQRIKESHLSSGAALKALPFKDQRELILLCFSGQDEAGKKYGIYIEPLKGKPRRYRFIAYGRIGTVDGFIIARSSDFSIFFQSGINDDNALLMKAANIITDYYPELKIKSSVHSKRDAHHGVRLYQRQ